MWSLQFFGGLLGDEIWEKHSLVSHKSKWIQVRLSWSKLSCNNSCTHISSVRMSLVFCQRHKTTNWSSSGSDFFFQKSNKVRTNFSTQKGYISEIEFGMILLCCFKRQKIFPPYNTLWQVNCMLLVLRKWLLLKITFAPDLWRYCNAGVLRVNEV